MKAKLPELLAPAGSRKAIEAAVSAGADAVYFGGKSHNARIFADNIDDGELKDIISLCHAYGAKSYITLNTLTHSRELGDVLKFAELLYRSGADALILADLGLASMIKRYIPDFELHASTQVSGHNTDAARKLADLGFSRMVLAREMPLSDIRSFCENSPIESEVFVHGALCVSASGQCLFSSLVGGRSGNRGECAQPCRLPYTKGTCKKPCYPLSLRDLSLAPHIPALIDAGVASLKIEGRMKSPEYVRDVTAIYRTLLDERRAANADETAELARIFSRSGFTDGYFTGKVGANMLGVRTEREKAESRELVPFDKITKKIPLFMSASFNIGRPASLRVSDGKKSVTVYGASPVLAENSPTPKENIIRQLAKLGATPYEAAQIECEAEDGLLIPLSKINELRRDALDALMSPDMARTGFVMREIQKENRSTERTKKRSARFLFAKNLPSEGELERFFDIVYLPLAEISANKNGAVNGVILPGVIFDSEMPEVEKMLKAARGAGITHALVSNIGHIELAKKYGFILHGDFRLNVYNTETAKTLESLGVEDVILSPELSLAQSRDIAADAAAVVYGRIPLMLLERCVIEDCGECGKNSFTLTDRRGVSFPVFREYPHRNVLYNSVRTYMADRADEMTRARVGKTHFIFSDESEREVLAVIEAYKKQRQPKGNVRRIK